MTIKITNLKKFEKEIEEFAKLSELSVQQVIDKVTLDLFGDIIKRTPVDLGYARANWFISPNEPNTETLEKPEEDSVDYEAENNKQLSNVKNAKTYFITNNVPYIVPLEEGHSAQAGKGHMVKRSISKAQQEITNIVRELKK